MSVPLKNKFQEVLSKNQNKTVLVLGQSGQLAKALQEVSIGLNLTLLDRSRLDLSHSATVENSLNCLFRMGGGKLETPDLLINATAYTQVDLAEKEFELARQVNALSIGAIARWCAQNRVRFAHVSTDYVFDGSGTKPWKELDPCAPVSIYGKTKREGELAILDSKALALIIRTSWVYDHQGKNFLNTMIKLGSDRKTLKIVNDQIGAPTYAPHLAMAVLIAGLSEPFKPDLFHFCGLGETSWFEFAQNIFKEIRSQSKHHSLSSNLIVENLVGIPTAEYPTPAKRPRNSRLDLRHFEKSFGVLIPDWKEGLKECISRKML